MKNKHWVKKTKLHVQVSIFFQINILDLACRLSDNPQDKSTRTADQKSIAPFFRLFVTLYHTIPTFYNSNKKLELSKFELLMTIGS